MIPPVVASDRGIAQTGVVATRCRGCRTAILYFKCELNELENSAIEGESPVNEA